MINNEELPLFILKTYTDLQKSLTINMDSTVAIGSMNEDLHWLTIETYTDTGLSFEAGCRRNSTSTHYSAAGYFLRIKDKKNAQYISKAVLVTTTTLFFHYQSLIIVTTIDLSIVNNTSQTGRRVTVFHWPAKVWYPCMAWTNFIPKTSRPWHYLTKHHQSGGHTPIPYL